jgi:pyruvate kinase
MQSPSQPVQQRARTKIVATVGPACSSVEQLGELLLAGVDVFRINTAHGNTQQHDQTLANIRAASAQQDRPIAILVDLAGPKIRLGQLVHEPLDCPTDAEFTFIRGESSTRPDELTTNYPKLIDELDPGDRVLLADGTVGMCVLEATSDRVRCRVFSPGILRSRQGVNLPRVKLSVPSITDADRQHAEWAAKNDADYVSLSFVRSPHDIFALRTMLDEFGSHAMTIAKIEKPEALDCLEEIVREADGVMVARGDLGVEIDIEETPVQQKRIIDTCTRLQRPVIVATQMLDSMQSSRRPTRAEVSDIANAILDGADACMLSGETAIGDYPTASVETMNRIMLATERMLPDRTARRTRPDKDSSAVNPVTDAVVRGASSIARRLDAPLMAIQTKTGRTALAKSKQRCRIKTIAVSDDPRVLRQMALFWGIEPLDGAPHGSVEFGQFISQWGKDNELLKSGDFIVLMASADLPIGAHNGVVVHQVP